jgi:hypothetical protein
MKTADLVIAVNTVWLQKTHGSPVSPLLHTSRSRAGVWAALGQSPAPPNNAASSSDVEGNVT